MTTYWRYNAKLGCWGTLTEKEFQKAVTKKYILPVYDSYFQTFSKSTYYDSRDRIATVFYLKREAET